MTRTPTAAAVLDLFVDCVAAYRLTKLITDDEILADPRGRVVEAAYMGAGQHGKTVGVMRAKGMDPDRPDDWALYAMADRDAPKISTLVTCRWCTGAWIGFGVLAARVVAPRQWSWVARALTAAAAAALIAGLEK